VFYNKKSVSRMKQHKEAQLSRKIRLESPIRVNDPMCRAGTVLYAYNS
jgi:hypothetical protein